MNKSGSIITMILGSTVVSGPVAAGTIYTTYVSQESGVSESVLAAIDATTGAVTEVGLTGMSRVGALTYDSQRGRLLGVGLDMNDDPLLIQLDLITGAATEVGPLGHPINGTGGLAYIPSLDMLFGSDLVPGGDVFGQLLAINPTTGQGMAIGELQTHVATSFAYYPPTGQLLFTSGFEEFGAPFGSWDPVTGVQTVIGPTATVGGMDYDADVDVLYGINGGTSATGGLGDKLFTIDPLTGEATVLVTLDRAEFYSSLAVVPIPAPGVLVIGTGGMWMWGSRRRRR